MKPIRWQDWARGLAFLLALALFSWAAAYGAAEWIFSLTGRPFGLAAHILTSLLGLVFLVLFFFLSVWFHRHTRRGRRHAAAQDRYWNGLLDAIARMAQGDFDVFVTPEGHRFHRELAESFNRMARELRSMESLRQDFISNVSHEIQSPLTSIGGFATLLKNAALQDEERTRYLEIIETECGRLSKLSENLLKLSTLESLNTPSEPRSYRLDRQIENVVLMLEPQWAAKDLAPELSLDRAPFSGDEDLLSQVWINLLHNAIKFSPVGGTVGISLSRGPGNVLFRISDEGIGIPPEEQLHIFERFYKVDKSRDRAIGGSGLGLALARKIVDMHGGKISVESRPGKGAAFAVELPCAETPPLP